MLYTLGISPPSNQLDVEQKNKIPLHTPFTLRLGLCDILSQLLLFLPACHSGMLLSTCNRISNFIFLIERRWEVRGCWHLFIQQPNRVRADGFAVLLAFPSMSLDDFYSSTFKASLRKNRKGQGLYQERSCTLVYCDGYNTSLQIQWLKTTHVCYLTVLDVRSLEWVSLG